MKSPIFAPGADRRTIALLAAVWIPAALLVYLLAVQPYSSGYLYVRLPILQAAAGFWNSPDWEHCGLVPLASAFILYLEKDRLASLPIRPSAGGLLVAALGFLLYWAGYRVDNVYFGYASIQILLAGMILTILGWKFMGALFFPWVFLTFMWPVLFLENYLAFPLRLIMSEASVTVLNAIGIPAIKSGTAILSASESVGGIAARPAGALFSVDVANPCSGIRSLFALMMVSALYGYFTLASGWKRLALFFCAAPLAILGNLFRILMLTIGTLAFGADFAIGQGLEKPSTFHLAAGFVVFAVALAGMVGIHQLLEWNPRKRKTVEPPSEKPAAEILDAKRGNQEDEY
ncbi:MAG TPA: exosortase/archaeosortase family protein [Chthoniobacterales bacterium]